MRYSKHYIDTTALVLSVAFVLIFFIMIYFLIFGNYFHKQGFLAMSDDWGVALLCALVPLRLISNKLLKTFENPSDCKNVVFYILRTCNVIAKIIVIVTITIYILYILLLLFLKYV